MNEIQTIFQVLEYVCSINITIAGFTFNFINLFVFCALVSIFAYALNKLFGE